MVTKPPVLIINSYGGSITLAATQEEHPILASCEDHNFGLDSQRLNFPHLNYRSELADWDLDMDLKGAIVIAHPPCAAFSSQNRGSASKRGPGAEAFACTTRLLEHVMPRRPEAVAIESVPGALEGARHVHDFYAAAHGYDLYRVLQNAASFGVPQWRRRFWAIFVKQQPGRKREFTFVLNHNVRYLNDVLGVDAAEGELDITHTTRWGKQLDLLKELGYTEKSLRELLSGTTTYGNIIHILAEAHGYEHTKGWPPFGKLHDYIVGGNFLSGALHVLNPNGLAPVLLGPCWWWLGKRQLGYADYKQIMGFPADYRYHKPRLTFVLLSKGVCPPVARWILREISANVFGIARPQSCDVDVVNDVTSGRLQTITIQPNETADLRTPEKWRERPKS